MDEQAIQQNNQASQSTLRVLVRQANVVTSTKKRKPAARSGLAMHVNVIPKDEDMPGFVRGYN